MSAAAQVEGDRTNPKEDWATCWEVEFYGPITEQFRMVAKLNELDDFFQAARAKQP